MPRVGGGGEKGKKRHLWMRRKEREGHGGSLDRAKSGIQCPLPSNMALSHEEKTARKFLEEEAGDLA